MPKDKYIQKECPRHGITEFTLEKRGYYRCKKCRVDMVSRRRKMIKQMALDYKGKKCEICGYDKCPEALEFHHLWGKDFSIGQSGYTRSWERVKNELDKCRLLCANCHREIHASQR